MKKNRAILLCSLLLLLYACGSKKADVPKKIDKQEVTVKGNFSAQNKQLFDSAAISAFLDSFPKFRVLKNELISFYQGRKFAYAWFDEKGMIEQASNLYNSIKNIQDDGLDSSKQLYLDQIGYLMENTSESFNDSSTVFTELMLTAQYLWYAKNVWSGLDEKASLSLEWLLPRNKIAYSTLLDSLIAGKDLLASPPVYRQYYLLKDYLHKYRSLAAADTILISLTKNESFKINDSAAMIIKIRQKLFLLGDLSTNSNSPIFDSSLYKAVQYFQERHGLTMSGLVKTADVTELNVKVQKRIEQIMANMERSRWVPTDLKKNHLIVNIPEFKLHAIERDSLIWSMNVVVGKSQNKTVVFNGDIKYVVFSPYWNVPASIMKNETLPAIRRNKNYLSNHNMEWNGNSIRQKPGANNSLGLVKFLFPNSHSIYLHDSPAKSLFNESSRAFSHGCIRVAEAKKLAMYLLRGDNSWTNQTVSEAMNAGKERFVTIKEPVPVFIAYFTSWVSRNGQLQFRKDIYNRDGRLLQMVLE
ncbi:MAG: L,D-transpeptidase family protein [Ferruginibacter sp.]